MDMSPTSLFRFFRYIDVRGPNSCWNWTGARHRHGYGFVGGGGPNTRLLSHRASWMVANGPIPDGMSVCHKCDNRACVNPSHLFLGTHAENMADMYRKGRGAKGDSSGLSKLTSRDVLGLLSLKGSATQTEVADMYGVSQTAVWLVWSGRRWNHLTKLEWSRSVPNPRQPNQYSARRWERVR